jgi:cutinase
MKFLSAVSIFVSLAQALPSAVEFVPNNRLEARQSNSRNDLQNGGTCPPSIFIFARGSTESGNLVSNHR